MSDFSSQVSKITTGKPQTILMISPEVMKMPLSVKRYDDPFLPFGRLVIGATRGLVCGYLYDFTKYLALGAAGAIALERTIAYAGSGVLNILHGPFSHPNFMTITDETAFNADGLTTTSVDALGITRTDRGVFALQDDQLKCGDYMFNVAGEDVLYADVGDDYANELHKAIERFNDTH